MAKQVRAHAVISGKVQGVFFRMETQRTARHLGVTGWVRNTFEGTVEAVFEGDEGCVNSVLDWCRHGPPHAHVHHVEVFRESYTGEFDSFDIRYDAF